MSPASARALRRRRVAELRAAEPGLSLRQMAERLGISRDTVTRDLEEIDRAPAESAPPADEPVRPVDDPAPQLREGGRLASAGDASPDETKSATGYGRSVDAVSAALPRRIAAEELVIDLGRRPGMRRDLAALADTGLSHQDLIGQAVYALAIAYQQAISAGHIPPGPFAIRSLTVGPLLPDEFGPRSPKPAPPPAEGA